MAIRERLSSHFHFQNNVIGRKFVLFHVIVKIPAPAFFRIVSARLVLWFVKSTDKAALDGFNGIAQGTNPMTNHQNPSILIVEDDPASARVFQGYLKKETYDVAVADTGKKATAFIDEHIPDAVVLDLHLPDCNGMDILKHVGDKRYPTVVVVVTAHGSIGVAVDAMRHGAADFLLKPFNAERLIYTLKHSLERQRLTRMVESIADDFSRHAYCGFIGSSLSMQRVYRIIDSAAPSKASVFITGESGSGKEVCAEAIHKKSPRADKPFIALNCGAIPRDLLESEIFGHVKGAFTGAVSAREGAALQAHGGTLFLDEICEMDPALQVKLLRFIQSGTIQKVGSSETTQVDVRFICATNRDPWAEVRSGNFREDLYYRLHVIPIEMPPLRDRDGDVLELAEHFLEKFTREEGKDFTGMSTEAQKTLLDYDWPGNVREMQNILRNAVVLNAGARVETSMLPACVTRSARRNPDSNPVDPPPVAPLAADAAAESAIRPMWRVERDMILAALSETDGNVPLAARMLEMSPSTIYRRLREIPAEEVPNFAQAS